MNNTDNNSDNGKLVYFATCNTVEAVKAEYRRLAKLHHPDIGGDTETMQELNAQYHRALERMDGQRNHDDQGREHTYTYNRDREQEIMDKLGELLAVLPGGVEIALIGLWLWIIGTEKEDKDTQGKLKEAGCRWHSKRKCWYWRPASMKHYGRQNKGGLASMAMKYGCRTFESRDEKGNNVAVA